MNDIMKISNFLEECDLLIKGVSKTNKNEAWEQKRGFLGLFLGFLDAILSANLSTSKNITKAGEGIIRAGKATITADQDFWFCLTLQ